MSLVVARGIKIALSLSINGRAQVHRRLFRLPSHLPGACSGTISRVPAESPCTYRRVDWGGLGAAGVTTREKKVREEKREREKVREREWQNEGTRARRMRADATIW